MLLYTHIFIRPPHQQLASRSPSRRNHEDQLIVNDPIKTYHQCPTWMVGRYHIASSGHGTIGNMTNSWATPLMGNTIMGSSFCGPFGARRGYDTFGSLLKYSPSSTLVVAVSIRAWASCSPDLIVSYKDKAWNSEAGEKA